MQCIGSRDAAKKTKNVNRKINGRFLADFPIYRLQLREKVNRNKRVSIEEIMECLTDTLERYFIVT
jgi:hypothetical protein